MRCPYCRRVDDKVVDSRLADDGAAIRRRRECLGCGRRFTTYERLEEVPLLVVKRSGISEPFDRSKIAAGIARAAKNRPVDESTVDSIVGEVEEELRKRGGPEVMSEQVGLAVLERPKETEPIYIGLLSHSAVPMRDMNVSYVLGMRIPGCLISTARTTGGHLPM